MELPKPRDLKYHDWDESVEPMVSIACLTENLFRKLLKAF